MKRELKNGLVQIEENELQRLCLEVKETLATGIVFPEAKKKNTSFSVADLWSLQKTMKTAGRNWNSKSRTFVVRG
ncbi:MAG: hypothetical protein ACXWV8_11265 [Chitinophagaceae bacterium]